MQDLAARARAAAETAAETAAAEAVERQAARVRQYRDLAAKLIGSIVATPVEADELEVHHDEDGRFRAVLTRGGFVSTDAPDGTDRIELAYFPAAGNDPERVKPVGICSTCGDPLGMGGGYYLRRGSNLAELGTLLESLTERLLDRDMGGLNLCACAWAGAVSHPDVEEEVGEDTGPSAPPHVDAWKLAHELLDEIEHGELAPPVQRATLAALVALSHQLDELILATREGRQ